MLTEQLIASVGIATAKSAHSSATKDAGIFVFEAQPHSQQRAAFKKSATNPNCLAVSASHVFAAQADKAVVNVYSREKGTHEATVPFPERIGCLALACDDSVLILGTNEGRIFLWETHTGRLVVTSQAHLQGVTAVSVDATSNFLLSGSADSSVHVWSIPSLLSFSNQDTHSPLHTLSAHRSAITALVTGHSSSSLNIAVSASKDNTAIIWDYQNNTLLRTILLPATPLSLALDPADRAVYATYEDGSVQILHFYSPYFSSDSPEDANTTHKNNPLYDEAHAAMPVQPPASTRWNPPSDDVGAALSAMLSYDGSVLTTGHASGKILTWDIPLSRYSSTFPTSASVLPGPVTNLIPLPITGFPAKRQDNSTRTKIHAVVKPKHGAFENRDMEGAVPGNYKIAAQLLGSLSVPSFSASEIYDQNEDSEFLRALSHPSFPSDMLSQGLAELESWNQQPQYKASAVSVAEPKADEPMADASADFMSLDAPVEATKPSMEQKNAQLEKEIEALRKVQRATLQQVEELKKENSTMMKKAKPDDAPKPGAGKNLRSRANGEWERLGGKGKSS